MGESYQTDLLAAMLSQPCLKCNVPLNIVKTHIKLVKFEELNLRCK